jgi:Holliday junction DNA helicase RuvB
MRERVITAEELQEEEAVSLRLRPSRLKDYIGQEQVKENLAIALRAAGERREPLEHVLFYGPPGLGKTTLAHIIAAEMGVGIKTSSGPALERASDLIGILTTLERGEVFFIDEIHRLPRVVEEYLYGAMEDFAIDFVQDKGPYARTIKLPIQQFTLVGATTRSGLLTAPLRERFGIFHHLDFYPEDDIVTIVSRSAKILEVPLDDDAAREIARRARGTPRIANRLLRRVRDYAQVKADGRVTAPLAGQALERLGVDARGLDDLDRKLLTTIIAYYQGGPVGIEALAATLGEQTDTLEEVVEPFLLKIGFISRTTRGRKASDLAYRHLNLERGDEQPKLF